MYNIRENVQVGASSDALVEGELEASAAGFGFMLLGDKFEAVQVGVLAPSGAMGRFASALEGTVLIVNVCERDTWHKWRGPCPVFFVGKELRGAAVGSAKHKTSD